MRWAVLASSSFGARGAEGGGDGGAFAGGGVGEAEDDEVGVAHEVAPGLGVLAAGRVDAEDGDGGDCGEAVADAESGGSRFAVDEDRSGHGLLRGTNAKGAVLADRPPSVTPRGAAVNAC